MGNQMLTLAITSSTDVVGVALGSEGQVLGSQSVTTDRRHAEELMPMVVEVLAKAGAEMGDLGLMAVDVGPGRFTGLRVGLTTVRALALALNLEVVSATSLELLAWVAPSGSVAVVIDARRGEVFQQQFLDGAAIGDAIVGDPASLGAQIQPGTVAVGDGADRFVEYYPNTIRGMSPSPEALIAIVEGREPLPGPAVLPLYMREPDVQINIKTRHNTKKQSS